MRRIQTSDFHRLSVVELLARNGIIEVHSRGDTVGYWVPAREYHTMIGVLADHEVYVKEWKPNAPLRPDH